MSDLTITGRLRIGLFPSFMSAKDESGQMRGFAAGLGSVLAERMGVGAELIEYRSPPDVVGALNDLSCDVGLLGIEPSRAATVSFTTPLIRAEFTFLVPDGSSVATVADAVTSSQRIAVVRNHAMDFALRGKAGSAELIYVDVPDEAFALIAAGTATVCAGIRPGLLAYAVELPGSRVLSDCYGANEIALAVAKDRQQRLSWMQDFVNEAKSSGLARHL
ncbi:MAG: transporter substrate-binding domain-containing protein, partial [Hyphomicrobiaceae bacterium]